MSLYCDVPRTKVYGTLKRLVNYDLVLEIPSVPKAFAPVSPDQAFNMVLNRVKSKAHDCSSIVKTLRETYESMKKESSPQKKVLWYLNEDDDIMGKCREIISQSEQRVVIQTCANGPSILFNLAPRLLDQLHERGIEVRFYSPLDPKTDPLARELSYLFAVKKADVTMPVLYIDSDHKRFILARLAEPNEKLFKSAIFSDDPTLISLISLLLRDEKNDYLMKTLPI